MISYSSLYDIYDTSCVCSFFDHDNFCNELIDSHLQYILVYAY